MERWITPTIFFPLEPVIPDINPPIIVLELPLNGTINNDENVTIKYNVTDDIAASLSCDIYSNTSGTWQVDATQIVANNSSSTYDYIGLANGNYRWKTSSISIKKTFNKILFQ